MRHLLAGDAASDVVATLQRRDLLHPGPHHAHRVLPGQRDPVVGERLAGAGLRQLRELHEVQQSAGAGGQGSAQQAREHRQGVDGRGSRKGQWLNTAAHFVNTNPGAERGPRCLSSVCAVQSVLSSVLLLPGESEQLKAFDAEQKSPGVAGHASL